MFHIYLVSVICLKRYSEILGDHCKKIKGLKTYKELEVLERMLNDYGRRCLIPAAMSVIPVIEITSMCAMFKMHGEISIPGFFIFLLAFQITFTGLSLLKTVSGRLKVTSENLLENWSRFRGVSKYYRRKIRAMQPLTVRFASNFLDRETALVTQDFCINQTVSLLMM